MTPDASSLLGQVTWSDEASSLFDVLKSHELPLLVKVHKGQYLNVGPGGISSLGVHHTLLLTSGGRRRRLVAQGIKFKDNRRLVPVGQKLLIPDTFEGFFEILNEEGRAVRAIESVTELARLFPDSCIVRCSCKAYVSKSDNVDTITERSRTIHAGETLVLVGEVSRTRGRGPNRFLRCFDSGGENIYLPLEQKVKISAVAKEENISGVHSIANLLNKRLPLNVRLVSGRPPDGSRVGGSQTVPEIRLHTTYEDELVVGMSLHKDTVTVAMPKTAPLRVQVATNGDQVTQSPEFARLCDRAAQVWLNTVDRIHPFDIPLPKDPRVDGKTKPITYPRPRVAHRSVSQPMSRITRVHSGETVDEYDEIDQIYDYVRGFAPLPKNMRAAALGGKPINQSAPQLLHRSPERQPSDSREAPVKSGDARPAETSRGPEANKGGPKPSRPDQPPEPPPIETIPSRRLSLSAVRPFSLHPGVFANAARKPSAGLHGGQPVAVDKRQKDNNKAVEKQLSVGAETKTPAGKLFTKNCNARANQRFSVHKGKPAAKSGSVNRYPLPDAVRSTGQLFDLRYKSLTNLAMDFGDTLNSSNSGGRTSGDSGDSAALLKLHRPHDGKPTKKLMRPKSMTNLVWEVQQSPQEVFQKPSIIADHERKLRLEPGVYAHRNSSVLSNNKYNNLKKIGTLYL